MSSKVKLIPNVRGIRGVDITRTLEVRPSIVGKDIHHEKRSRRIGNYIARRVRMKREELFGKEAA
jgi:hypothetical protein